MPEALAQAALNVKRATVTVKLDTSQTRQCVKTKGSQKDLFAKSGDLQVCQHHFLACSDHVQGDKCKSYALH